MNTPVNFELAKLLKKKGFEQESDTYYTTNGELKYDSDYPALQPTKPYGYYDAPAITEVVMWLYEKHRIYIHISPHGEEEDLIVDCKWWFSIYKDKLFNLIGGSKVTEGIEDFDSPTKAYEAAIEYTLNKLIK